MPRGNRIGASGLSTEYACGLTVTNPECDTEKISLPVGSFSSGMPITGYFTYAFPSLSVTVFAGDPHSFLSQPYASIARSFTFTRKPSGKIVAPSIGLPFSSCTTTNISLNCTGEELSPPASWAFENLEPAVITNNSATNPNPAAECLQFQLVLRRP